MAWASGQKLQGGKYTIEESLGLGGFGITYLAQTTNKRKVVIKTLNDSMQRRSDFDKCQQDFLNEALRLARCSHPHIVRIEEVIQEEGLWCMVMEYIAGVDLATRVENQGALPEAEALHYIQQVGSALTVVHNHGLLHRDVKPQNIVVVSGKGVGYPPLQAVLIDFGIAREFTPNLTQTHTEHFSGGFSPIEQYDKRCKRGAYTDVYALAATFYTLLTAEVPPIAPVRFAGIPLVPPKQINPRISDTVNQAILKGMELKPEKRPQSMPEWLALLGLKISIAPTIHTIPKSSSLIALPPPPPQPYYLAQPTTTTNSVKSVNSVNSVKLTSAVGVDYRQLRALLAAGKWKDADEETANKMCEAVGRSKEGYLREEDIKTFFSEDLNTIDSLWVEYSNGRFGFSVQRRIWESVNKDLEKFAARVGWIVKGEWVNSYDDLTFNLSANPGHLPFWWSLGCAIGKWGSCCNFLFSRRDLFPGADSDAETSSPLGKLTDMVWRSWR